MRDGTVLRADVYSPDDAASPLPAIVNRTPYERRRSATVAAGIDPEVATANGFVLVCQDVRGRGGSDGQFATFLHDGDDTYDTVEWVAAQPWCSGAVGMTGRSYGGATQWLGAVRTPPHLKAMFPVVIGSNYYDSWIYQGGAFQLGFNLFWTRLMGESRASQNLDALYRHLPLPTVPMEEGSVGARIYQTWLSHPTFDDYWKGLAVNRRYGQVTVPAYNVGGWYDLFLRGTLENYVGMRERGGSPEARGGQRLLIGPWAHGSTYGPYPDHNFADFEGNDDVDLDDVQVRFFACHLRGDDNGFADEAPVRLFVMGANRWRDEDTWPPPAAVARPWYLRAGGGLSPEPPAHGDAPDTYVYDPADPAPTVGGPTSLPAGMMKTNSGPRDQQKVESRADVLVYTSEPLTRAVEVTGALTVTLHAATSAVDTDFVAKLTDVDPDGRSTILAEGILRCRYRKGFEEPQLMTPGRPEALDIDLVATSNVFKPGHRIRVVVTSSSFPRFDRNANSGRPFGTDGPDDLRPAHQTVFHDAARPSHIVLPIVG